MRHLIPVLAFIVLLPATARLQQKESYDYWRVQRDMIQRGQQAIMMCNGLFTSNRTLDQVFAQELAYVREPVGTAAGGGYEVDRDRQTVAVGTPGVVPVMRAVFRRGLGCIILAPDQTFNATSATLMALRSSARRPASRCPPRREIRPRSPGLPAI